jgi:hypothetical protein
MFNNLGVKLLIIAFETAEFSTNIWKDPEITATNLANFIINKNLDGVDVVGMIPIFNSGDAASWLITLTLQPEHYYQTILLFIRHKLKTSKV